MHLYISNNRESVDASLVRKDHAVATLISRLGLTPSQVAVIGHRTADIPLFNIADLGLVATVYNADPAVKQALCTQPHKYESPSFGLDGFLDIHRQAQTKGLKHIITVRDGVLYRDGDLSRGGQFRNAMIESPIGLSIITAIAAEKTKDFAHAYSLRDLAQKNQQLLHGENGAVHVDYANGSLTPIPTSDDIEGIRTYKKAVLDSFGRSNPFQRNFVGAAAESDTFDDACPLQVCYIPKKHTMLTIEIPESTPRQTNFQATPLAAQLRKELVQYLSDIATKMGIPYDKV